MNKELANRDTEIEKWKRRSEELTAKLEQISQDLAKTIEHSEKTIQTKNIEISALKAEIDDLNKELTRLKSGSSSHISELENVRFFELQKTHNLFKENERNGS